MNTLFPLKGFGRTEIYLRGNIDISKDDTWDFNYVMSGIIYINNVFDNIETIFETNIRSYGSPFPDRYHPELDTSQLLIGDHISKYRLLIICLDWADTKDRLGVCCATSTLGRYQIAPKQVHLGYVLRIFGYLKHYIKQLVIFDSY